MLVRRAGVCVYDRARPVYVARGSSRRVAKSSLGDAKSSLGDASPPASVCVVAS
jgi:hypothetical protein